MSRAASLAVITLLACTDPAGAFSTRSVRFFGTGGGTAVDRITVPIDPPTAADVGAEGFTVELWLRGTLTDNSAPTQGFRAVGQTEADAFDWIWGNIIVDRDTLGAGPDWGVSIHRDGPLRDQGVVRFGTASATAEHTLQGTVHVLDGAWHHVAVVREGAGGRKRIYVDGAQDVESAAGVTPGDLRYPDGRATTAPDSDPFLVFGAEKHGFPGDGDAPSFAGWVDEIRVWSVARTGMELAGAATQTLAGSTPGLALYLRLEEGSGQALEDTANGNTATLYAGVAGEGEWSVEVPPGAGTTTTTVTTSTTSTTGSISSTTTSTGIPPSSSTTSSTSTTTSTVGPSSTSTTAPPCTANADCDDGDPCTIDRCLGPACRHDDLPRLEGASCRLGQLLTAPLCPPDSIDETPARRIGKRLGKARRDLERAIAAGDRGRRSRRHSARAARRLARVQRKITRLERRGKMKPLCRDRLDETIRELGLAIAPTTTAAARHREAAHTTLH